MSKDLCPQRAHRDLTIAALRTARRTTGGSALPAAGATRKVEKDVFTLRKQATPVPASHHAQGMIIRSRMAALAPLRATSEQERFAKATERNKCSCQRHEHLPLADLVVLAGWLHPFPFRTRP